MHNIKITKVEFRNISNVIHGKLYNYLLHRDDNGTPFSIHIDHYMKSFTQRAKEIEYELDWLQRSLEGKYGYISNLFDTIN